MRYILKRELFLDQQRINEVFENELTWGGSWLGRLINSTIRVSKINYKSLKIEGVNDQIVATIYEILKESMDKDSRVKLYRFRIKNLVTNIRNLSLTNKYPMWQRSVDCRGGAGDTKISKLIGRDPSDAMTPGDFSQTFKPLTSGILFDFFKEIDDLTKAKDGDQDLKNLLSRQDLDNLRNIHSDYIMELRKLRWTKCNPGLRPTTLINRKSKWKGRDIIGDIDDRLKNQISVKNETKIFKKFSEFEKQIKFIKEELETGGEYQPLFEIIGQLEDILNVLGEYKPTDEGLSEVLDYGLTNKIFQKWSSNNQWIKNLFVGDDESTKIFIESIIRSLYSIKFNFGKKLITNLSQERKDFISDLPDLLRYFSLIYSYLENLNKSGNFVDKDHSRIYNLIVKFFRSAANKKSEIVNILLPSLTMIGDGEHQKLISPTKYDVVVPDDKVVIPDDKVVIPDDKVVIPDDKVVIPDEIIGNERDDVSKIYNDIFLGASLKKEAYTWGSPNVDMSKYELTRDDEIEFKKLESDLVLGKFTLTRKKASDAIIRLFDLLAVAVDLFSTDYIPSGRPEGRISRKTFREYQYLDKGTEPVSKAPSSIRDAGGTTTLLTGYGPWAIKEVYRKFQYRMNQLLEDQELRKIFANINFSYPGSEDRFNDNNHNWDKFRDYEKINEKKETTQKKMGPVLFDLLQTLVTPGECGDGIQRITNARRRYFGLQEQSELPKSGNPGSNHSNDDSKVTTLQFKTQGFRPDFYGNWAISAEETTYEWSKISVTPLYKISRRNTLIFLTTLETGRVPEIKTTYSGTSLSFYPVKITFNTPLTANKYYINNRSDFDSYCDISDNAKPDPSVYYGYFFHKGDYICLFYVDCSKSPITRIDFQRIKMTTQIFNNRKNPMGDEPPKTGSFTLQKSCILMDNSNPISPYTVALNSDDRTNYETIFGRTVNYTSGKSFTEYMKSILEDIPANQDRLEELNKS